MKQQGPHRSKGKLTKLSGVGPSALSAQVQLHFCSAQINQRKTAKRMQINSAEDARIMRESVIIFGQCGDQDSCANEGPVGRGRGPALGFLSHVRQYILDLVRNCPESRPGFKGSRLPTGSIPLLIYGDGERSFVFISAGNVAPFNKSTSTGITPFG